MILWRKKNKDGMVVETIEAKIDKEKMLEWYRNISMPEIGPSAATFFAIIAFVCGVIIGTQCSLLMQVALVVAVVLFHFSPLIRDHELGIISYLMISFGFIAGIIVGDISYVFQVGIDANFLQNFYNLFKVK